MVALLAGAQEEPRPEILSPQDRSVIVKGPVRIIVRGEGEILLDGKALAAERIAPGVRTMTWDAASGAHQLALGPAVVRFHAGGNPPPGWKEFRPHPPAAACDLCHAVKNGEWAMKRASLVSLCFTCHNRPAFPATHTHNVDILAECQSCHFPHGSIEKAHLKLDKERACKQCHG